MDKRKGTRIAFVIVAALLLALIVACSRILGANSVKYFNEDGSFRHISAKESFRYAENHPAFIEFSSFIQPWKDKWNLLTTPYESIDFVCRLNRTNTASIVDGFNFVIDAAGQGDIYFDYYTDEERAADPTKEETGLIFVPGDKDKPVAFLTSGGAFKSVCLFLEGFPVGNKLHELGYNVVILKYRVDPSLKDMEEAKRVQEPIANEDFSRAVQFCFDHQKEWGVSMDDYSVWGFSAGGRTTSLWGLDNDYGYEAHGLPAPGAMVLVYSGWYDPDYAGQYGTVPPTYFAWLPNDDVIGQENISGIEEYMAELSRLGIPYEADEYYTAKHGFGEGRGTDAEGWIRKAVAFWEEQPIMKETNLSRRS